MAFAPGEIEFHTFQRQLHSVRDAGRGITGCRGKKKKYRVANRLMEHESRRDYIGPAEYNTNVDAEFRNINCSSFCALQPKPSDDGAGGRAR